MTKPTKLFSHDQATSRQIELRPISTLRAFGRNARTHSRKQLRLIADSIAAFGFTNPVLIDEAGTILAGHGRVEAAKMLGRSVAPVMVLAGMSEAQKRAYVIADNRLAEKAGWDRETLAGELGALVDLLPEIDLDLSITGFEIDEVDALIEDLGVGRSSPEDVPPVPNLNADPVCRGGDLWQLGRHRLICGDVRDAAIVARLMDGALAEMIFTDPPYNVRIDGNAVGRGRIRHREFAMASGEMSRDAFVGFLKAGLANLAAASIDGAIHYVCMDWRHLDELTAAGASVYTELKNLCVWVKTNAGQGSFYRSQHELVFVFKNGAGEHINTFGLGAGAREVRSGEAAFGAGRARSNVWTYPGVNAFSVGRLERLAAHPTVKPVALVADAMRDCSARNGIVLDGFAGSGTIFIAAERVGRRGYGVEIDPVYVDVCIRRWQALTKADAVNVVTGLTFDETLGRSDGKQQSRASLAVRGVQ